MEKVGEGIEVGYMGVVTLPPPCTRRRETDVYEGFLRDISEFFIRVFQKATGK